MRIKEEIIFFIENDFIKHTENVVDISMNLADTFHIQNKKALMEAAVFHDFGKIIMIDRLAKRGPLSKTDRKITSLHPNFSISMTGDYISSDAAILILLHHTYIDGTGYPKVISGKELPLQILQASDLYDALNSPRVYRKRSVDGWQEIILKKVGNKDILESLSGLNFKKLPHFYTMSQIVKDKVEHYFGFV
jgi:response regulator RpfG family c-di-GMP phosphodiesterase